MALGTKERAPFRTILKQMATLPISHGALTGTVGNFLLLLALEVGASGHCPTDTRLQIDFLGTLTSCFVGSLLKLMSLSLFYYLVQVPFVSSSGTQKERLLGASAWLTETVAAWWQHSSTNRTAPLLPPAFVFEKNVPLVRNTNYLSAEGSLF